MTTIAIDPGAKTCACACANSAGVLQFVRSVPSFEKYLWLEGDRAVYEVPQVDGRDVPGDDLLAVAAAGAQLAAWCAPVVVRYQPRQWKGNVPKPIHHYRLFEVLSHEERNVLGGAYPAVLAAGRRGAKDGWRKPGASYYRKSELPPGITHDILDAVALLMFDLGRLPGPTSPKKELCRKAKQKR